MSDWCDYCRSEGNKLQDDRARLRAELEKANAKIQSWPAMYEQQNERNKVRAEKAEAELAKAKNEAVRAQVAYGLTQVGKVADDVLARHDAGVRAKALSDAWLDVVEYIADGNRERKASELEPVIEMWAKEAREKAGGPNA